MAQHNTKACKTWRARECVYVTFSYSLCSGSHLLLHLKPNKGQLFPLSFTETVKFMCCCAVSSDSEHSTLHADTGSKNAMQLKYHIVKILGDCTLNFLQVT